MCTLPEDIDDGCPGAFTEESPCQIGKFCHNCHCNIFVTNISAIFKNYFQMPVHQNVNILHGHVGQNAVQHVVVAKNHVTVNVTAQMDIHQISAKTMVNATVNHEKKRTATRTLNVHQNVNSVRTGNHGCPAQRLAEAEPRADRRNANARNGSI